jgi:hypothetical protein
VSEIEWEQWVAILEQTPPWARARLDAVGEQRWSAAHDVVRERMRADCDVAARLERAVGDGIGVALELSERAGPTDTLERWTAWRARFATWLRGMEPDRWGVGLPGDAGRTVVSAEVRGAAERDLAARRALRNASEGQ